MLSIFILLINSQEIKAQIDSRKANKDALSGLYIPPTPIKDLKKTEFLDPKEDEKKFRDALKKAIDDRIAQQKLLDLNEKGILTPQQIHKKRIKAENSKKVYAKIDKDLGVLESTTEEITIICRDYGDEDNDLIKIVVNDETMYPTIRLTNNYKKFVIPINLGITAINFIALNEGYGSPNTAAFIIFDENGIELMNNNWALATGAKAKFSIIRIPKI